MSERMTAITLPGIFGAGYADYGRKTVPEMLATLRRHALADKAVAEAILAAPDSDFRVDTYVGVHKQRDREVIQEGRKASRPEESVSHTAASQSQPPSEKDNRK